MTHPFRPNLQSGPASRWMICSQQGLPSLFVDNNPTSPKKSTPPQCRRTTIFYMLHFLYHILLEICNFGQVPLPVLGVVSKVKNLKLHCFTYFLLSWVRVSSVWCVNGVILGLPLTGDKGTHWHWGTEWGQAGGTLTCTGHGCLYCLLCHGITHTSLITSDISSLFCQGEWCWMHKVRQGKPWR